MDKRTFIALAIMFTVTSVFLFNSFYKEAENTAITELNEEQTIHAKQAARGIEDFFATWTRNLNTLSKIDAVIDNGAVGKSYIKLFYEANQEQIKSITRLDERGVILYNFPSSRAEGTDISDQKHIQELLRDHRPVISDVFRAVEGVDSVALHVPVFRGSEFKGSIGVLINFETLAKRYLDVIRIGQTGYARVVSRDGTLLYSPVPGAIGKSVFATIEDSPSLIVRVNDMLRGHEGAATYTFNRTGDRSVGQTRKYAVYMPVRIGNTFWSIAVTSAEEDVLSGLISFRNKPALVIGALFICGMVVSILGAKAWFVVKEEGKRKQAEKQLVESEEWLRDITFSMGDWVWEVDEKGVYTYSSAKGSEILGRSGEDIIGKTPFDFMPPEEAKKIAAIFSKIAVNKASIRDLENWNIRKDGGRICLLTNGVPMLDGDGNLKGYRGVDRDITERKLAEVALEESRTQITAVMNSTKDFIWSVDPERFGLLTWNRAFRDYFFEQRGIELEVGMTPAELVPPDYVPLWHGLFSRTLREEFVVTEYVVVAQTKNLLLSLYSMKRGSEAFGISVFGKDITERKRAEGALLASEERFRALAESALVGIYVLQDGKYAYVNPAMARIFGYSVAEMTGMSPREIVQPCDYGTVGENIRRRITGEVQAIQYEVRGKHKNGSTRDVEVYGTRMEMNGRPALVGTLIDITERKRADEALRISEERYRGLVEAQTEMVCTFLPDTTLLFVNGAYMRYYGRTREDLIGNKFLSQMPAELHGDIIRYYSSFRPDSPIRNSQRETVFPDGECHWQEWTDHAFFDENGQLTGFQSVGRDITERKKSEEALKMKEEALRNSQKDFQRLAGRLISAQEEELSRLSRELHDDLTQRLAVLAIEAGKLEADLNKIPETCRDTLLTISQIKEQLITVSEDVHHLSRQLHPSILDDLGIVRAIESECALFMKRDNIQVSIVTANVPSAIPKDIALCLYRVTQESLKNVVKHSQSGIAEIALSCDDFCISLSIRDTGMGFDPARVRQQPGLGLASMRERVALVGGDFSIKSQSGKGTVITVCVPLTGGDV